MLLGVGLQSFTAQPHLMFAVSFLSANQCKPQSHAPVDIPSSLVSQKESLSALILFGDRYFVITTRRETTVWVLHFSSFLWGRFLSLKQLSRRRSIA